MVSLRQKLVSLDHTGRESFAGAGWFWTVRAPMSKSGQQRAKGDREQEIEKVEKICFQVKRRFVPTVGCSS
jgi:hypothetical protein